MDIQVRTVSRNGQVAIPRRFLAVLGAIPPVKVQVICTRDAVIIRSGPMTRLSNEAFQAFLTRVRRRNARVTHQQAEEVIRGVRRTA